MEADAGPASALTAGLRQSGFDTTSCQSLEDAVDAISRRAPDVVIWDLAAASADGRHALTTVRDEVRQDTSFILVSDSDVGVATDEVLNEWSHRAITRPVDMAEVRSAIDSLAMEQASPSEEGELAESLDVAQKALASEVSRRKFAEEALQTSLRRLELAYDQMTLHTKELKDEIEHRKEAEYALARSEELRRIQAAKDAMEAERKRIAEELHDETLAEMASVAIELGFLQGRADDGTGDLADAMGELRERVRVTEQRLRQLVQGIYPSVLTNLGLIPALRAYLEDLSTRPIENPTPLDIEMRAKGFDSGRPSEAVEIACYRFIQQGIVNAIQHARATSVVVELDWKESELSIQVSDDGVGFGVETLDKINPSGHFGLVNLRDRVEGAEGSFEIDSTPSVGTTVRGTVPVEDRSAAPGGVQVSKFTLRVLDAAP